MVRNGEPEFNFERALVAPFDDAAAVAPVFGDWDPQRTCIGGDATGVITHAVAELNLPQQFPRRGRELLEITDPAGRVDRRDPDAAGIRIDALDVVRRRRPLD